MIRRVRTLRTAVFLLLWLLPVIYTTKSRKDCRRINAAFSFTEDSRTFFISGNEYIEYSSTYQSEANVGPMRALGLAPSLKDVDAAFSTNVSVYFLKGCNFYKYKITQQQRRILHYRAQGPLNYIGLPCDVDAALNWAEDILVFSGCQIWKLNAETWFFHPDGNLTDRGLPCDLDAAAVWGRRGEIFVKGAQYWKFDSSMQGPFHTDDLHLCSWYLCGEADWMLEKRPSERCNGDSRFCGLRLDQVTMAGLHNAGSGFAGGFGLGFDCLLRNHAESITRQLELGIRHLDIDPCYDKCGLLGTCHAFECGGSICAIIKQLRTFLRDHRNEVVTVNFNHEITQPEKVFPSLSRQLRSQLGPMLNKRFRGTGGNKWPTLSHSIQTNRRVFIFYAPDISEEPYNKDFKSFKWIHNENLYGSTWQEFNVFTGCQKVVNITSKMCKKRQQNELIEVSIIPKSGLCIPKMADTCRPYLHESLEACEGYRFQRQKSPNVLLVDYPEIGRDDATSVFNAVYHQNLRNVIAHLSSKCQVKVDAAVKVPGTDTSLFFVGDKMLVYSHSKKSQVDSRQLTGVLTNNIDAAYILPGTNTLRIMKGRQMWDVRADNISQLVTPTSRPSHWKKPDGAVVWRSRLHVFKDCHVTPQDQEPIALADWGLPCNIDAALDDGDHVTVFKGNHYWKYTGQGNATLEGKTLDWRIDAVRCCGGKPSAEHCKNSRKSLS